RRRSTFSARLSGASGVPPTSAGQSGDERRRAKRAHCALLNPSHETGSRAVTKYFVSSQVTNRIAIPGCRALWCLARIVTKRGAAIGARTRAVMPRVSYRSRCPSLRYPPPAADIVVGLRCLRCYRFGARLKGRGSDGVSKEELDYVAHSCLLDRVREHTIRTSLRQTMRY